MADRKYALIFELQNGSELKVEFTVPQGDPGAVGPEGPQGPEGLHILDISIREV